MKVSLVVASGAHEGRVIPLTGPEFLIGRDQQCHLRPASQAISKLHCAVIIRDGKVYLKDFGSTNGTLVNEDLIQNVEVAIQDGASLRVGPLDFRVTIEIPAPNPDGTPLPSVETSAALAAVKAATAAPGTTKTPTRDATPNPIRTFGTPPQPVAAKSSSATAPPAARPEPAKSSGVAAQPAKPASPAPTKPGSKEGPALKAGGSKEGPALKTGGSKEGPALKAATPAVPATPPTNEGRSLTSSESVSEEDHDRIAEMLLGMDDEGNGNVPDGSTVMDIPSPLANSAPGATGEPAADGSKPGEKKDDGKPKLAQTREEMTSAANDLLRKYMRRPK